MGLDWPSVARLRQGFYRLYAAAFLEPGDERLRHLTAGAAYLDDWEVEAFAFAPSWRSAYSTLIDPPPLADLRSTHLSLFLVAPQGPACPPLESFHTSAPGRNALVVSELERAYRRLGVQVSSDPAVTADHVSTELEAMAYLCGREASAREDDNVPLLDEVLRAGAEFLNEHLARWLPRFADRVARADSTGFYGAIAGAADAFVRHDVAMIDAMSAPQPMEESV